MAPPSAKRLDADLERLNSYPVAISTHRLRRGANSQ
jgi:hypothetical protein